MPTRVVSVGMGCEFCAIAAGDAEAHEVHRDEATVAFLDVNPAAEGHTLVVPTAHREGLPDMGGDEAAALFRTVRDTTAALQRAFEADGVSVFQSSGAAAGQDVFHVHVHVIPRFEGDDIRFAPRRERLTDAEGEAVASRVREAMAAVEED